MAVPSVDYIARPVIRDLALNSSPATNYRQEPINSTMNSLTKPIATVLALLAACMTADNARAEVISFETSTWDNGGGPSIGWTNGADTGTTTVLGTIGLTVTSSVVGTATEHSANLSLNGGRFIIVQLPADSTNPSPPGTLSNYMRIDFEFTEAVVLDDLTLGDIDTATNSWWDVIAVEGFTSGGAGAVGSGTSADYTFSSGAGPGFPVPDPGPDGTYLTEVTRFGLAAVTPDTNYNGGFEPVHEATASFGSTAITAFSLYYWNDRPDYLSGTNQVINIVGNVFELSAAPGGGPVAAPEPGTLGALCVGSLIGGVARYRKRRRRQAESDDEENADEPDNIESDVA